MHASGGSADIVLVGIGIMGRRVEGISTKKKGRGPGGAGSEDGGMASS